MKQLLIALTIAVGLLVLYGHSCNGKGPSAGCAGMIAYAIAAFLTLIILLLLVFTAGTLV